MSDKKPAAPSMDRLNSTVRAIKPAPDEHVDPVDSRPATTTAAAPTTFPSRGVIPEATVQLNVSVSVQARQRLEEIKRAEGGTLRAVIENAINTYKIRGN